MPGNVRELDIGKTFSEEHPDHSLGPRKVELPGSGADLLDFRTDGDEVRLAPAPHHARVPQEKIPMLL